MTQNEFEFLKPKKVDIEQIEFETLLLTSPCWRKAAEMLRMYGWTERQCRSMAHCSKGRIISGQLGYKHTRYAAPEELHHAKAWLRSQSRKMASRADEIEEKERQCLKHSRRQIRKES